MTCAVAYKVNYLSPTKTLADNLATAFIPPSFISSFHPALPLCSPPADKPIRKQSFKNTIISESSVVGNQLTFTSSLSPRLRTWMWSRRWSAWCWKSSTLACATLYTTTPTWYTRCSTRGSFLSSSGRTHPSRTSCRTWTRSVGFFPDSRPKIRSELKEAWTWESFTSWCWLNCGNYSTDQGCTEFPWMSSASAGKLSKSQAVLEPMWTASLT